MSVHNHPPYRPMCNERTVGGKLRGACMSMTLTEFLLERIAEDERHARKLAESDPRPVMSLAVTVNHPERILLECEAKRRIVEDEHFDGRSGNYVEPWCTTCSGDEELAYLPCPTLRLLALPYADHDDYRPEWRP